MLKEAVINNRKYELYSFTGTVMSEKTWSETSVSGSGGGNGGYVIPHYEVLSKVERFKEP